MILQALFEINENVWNRIKIKQHYYGVAGFPLPAGDCSATWAFFVGKVPDLPAAIQSAVYPSVMVRTKSTPCN